MYKEWNDSYSVGIQSIDEQHKKLFGMINALHEAIKQKRPREVMGRTLEELVEYTMTHFSDEETLMEKYGYPEFATHKQSHAALTVQVNDIFHRFRRGEPVISVELFGFLINWLKEHIQGTDKRYTAFLNSKGIR